MRILASFAACKIVEPSGTLTAMPFIFKLTIFILIAPLLFLYRVELTMRDTLSALDTFFQVDIVRVFYSAADCVCGAVTRAERTAAALVGIDIVIEKRFAHACGAVLVADMRNVLFLEMRKRRQYGVGRRLSQSAERRALHMLGNLLYVLQILFLVSLQLPLLEYFYLHKLF